MRGKTLDYGIRLLRHILAQVFGNLGQAARITAAPFLIFVAAAFVIFGPLFINFPNLVDDPAMMEDDSEFVRSFLGSIGLLLLGFVLFAWAAVAWHRFVLQEEYVGMVAPFSGGRVLGYVGRSLLLGLLLFLLMIPALFLLVPLFSAATQSGSLLLILPIGLALSVFLNWLLVRWSLILPAGAVDRKLRIGESWKATAPVSVAILVPIVVVSGVTLVLQQLVGFLPFGVVLSWLFTWLQMLVNLALLTTLYGTQIEGRELN